MVASLLALTGLASSCSDGTMQPDPDPVPASTPFVVSDPVAATLASTPAVEARSSSVGSITSTIYVSLPPGAIPAATEATIRNRDVGSIVIVPVNGGGFDPVGVTGAPGDTLDVAVHRPTTHDTSYVLPVFERARPTVVRTSPPNHKRDVSLNGLIVVVFSEPMDSASLADALTLTGGGSHVPGRVVIAPNGGVVLQITFLPDGSLAPLTTYTLAVGTGATDQDGDALASGVTSEFTTGTLPPDVTAPVVSVIGIVSGDTQSVDYPRLRAQVSDEDLAEVRWELVDSTGGFPYQFDWSFGSFAQGRAGPERIFDAVYGLGQVPGPGTYAVRVIVSDGAGNVGTSEPVSITFVDSDAQPRIVVRSFTLTEWPAPWGTGEYVYAPQLVVADAPGQSGLEILGLHLDGLKDLELSYGQRRWAQSLFVPPDTDTPLWNGAWWFGGCCGGRAGEQVRGQLTYRDATGHVYMATIHTTVTAGAAPQMVPDLGDHWHSNGEAWAAPGSAVAGLRTSAPRSEDRRRP